MPLEFTGNDSLRIERFRTPDGETHYLTQDLAERNLARSMKFSFLELETLALAARAQGVAADQLLEELVAAQLEGLAADVSQDERDSFRMEYRRSSVTLRPAE